MLGLLRRKPPETPPTTPAATGDAARQSAGATAASAPPAVAAPRAANSRTEGQPLRDTTAPRLSRIDELPPHSGIHPLQPAGIVGLIDAVDPRTVHIVATEVQVSGIYIREFRTRLDEAGYKVSRVVHVAAASLLQQLVAQETRPAEVRATAAPRSLTTEMEAFHEILREAIRHRASDIRLSVRKGGGQDTTTASVRANGRYRRLKFDLDAATGLRMISGAYHTCATGASGNLELWSGDLRQEAFLSVPSVHNIRLRYNLIPMADGTTGAAGPDCVMRILGYDQRSMRFPNPLDAGYSEDQAEALIEATTSPRGFMLFVGPVGSGKTTAMATLLALHPELLAGTINAYAIEDPPELDVPNLRSIPIKRKGGAHDEEAFTTAMRDLLRHDPDIVVPGEIRDRRSARLLEQMAYSNKVLATFHASDFESTLLRLASDEIGYSVQALAAPPFAGGLVAVASLRLLPRLCPSCSQPAAPHLSANEARLLSEVFGVSKGLRVRGPGCRECHGAGITGRTAIAEVVAPDDSISALIRASDFAGAYQLWRSYSDKNIESGVQVGKTVFEHALYKAQRGEVSIRDVALNVNSIATAARSARPR
jgi:general secretion pathway protein E